MAGKKFDVKSIVAAAASGAEVKKGKDESPRVELPQHAESINNWAQAHNDKKDAESRMAEAEAKFLKDVEQARVEACRTDGKYHSTVKVNGKISASAANRYSEIDTKDFPTIEKVFGDKTKDFFKERTEITLTEAALNDENIMQKLIEAVGAEKFTTYFDVKQFVKPTETFHEGRALDIEVGAKANVLMEQGIVKPSKIAVKKA